MDLVHKLNLNKHPKDNENLSLVNALNVKLSQDESCITNEESIKEFDFIKKYIINYFANEIIPAQEFDRIITIVPVTNELLIFATCKAKPEGIFIFRYTEDETKTTRIYNNSGFLGNIVNVDPATFEESNIEAQDDNYLIHRGLTYHGGKIKTAFTYNTRNDLILAITEYGVEGVDIPLRIINLGEFGYVNIESQFPNDLLSINPEIKIPFVTDIEYTHGNTYKGWYYLFYRLKISNYSNDYTQWYPIGYPIYIDDINKNSIIKYIFNRDVSFFEYTNGWEMIAPPTKKGFAVGATDNFSNEEDISNETFKIKLDTNKRGTFYYQIGAICISKSYTKAFKSNDIITLNGGLEEFIFNPKSMNDTSIDELIIDNYNPLNVQNITNYKNRLYISNYKEKSANKNIDYNIIDNISLNLVKSYFNEKSVVYDISVLTRDEIMVSNQYTSDKDNSILLSEYLGIEENSKVTITNDQTTYTDSAKYFNIEVESGKWGYAKLFYRQYAGLGQVNKIPIGTENNPISVISIHDTNKIITYNYKYHAISGGQPYINTKLDFNERKKNSTLIPGEIYNFFIHFVDKYGHATNGYRINNNHIIWKTENSNTEIIPYKLTFGDIDYYAALPIDDNIIYLDYETNEYKMNVDNIKFYENIDTNNYILSGEYSNPEYLRPLLLNKGFLKKEYSNFKWYQIIDSADTTNFNVFINSENDRLFKVPLDETFIKYIKYSEDIRDEESIKYKHLKYLLKVQNVIIPDGYVGYFISYEKHEPIQRLSGVLTRADFIQQRKIIDENGTEIKINTTNDEKSNTMLFYSSQFDIADNYKLDFNLLKINGVNVFDKMDIPNWDYYQRTDGFNYVYDMNKPMINSINKTITSYAMPEFNIAPANSSLHNRSGLGTALQIKDSYNLFNTDISDTEITLYYATLLNVTTDIYLNKDKTLIRLSDVAYNTEDLIIKNGYNGHWTYDGVLVYENSGVMFNDEDKTVRKLTDNDEFYQSHNIYGDTPHTYQNDIPFAAYMQFPVCTDIFYESKRFKNKPDTIVFVTHKDDTDETKNRFAIGSMVTPANTVDLFENPQGANNDFNLKFYSNYADWRINVDTFDKTVRRSNIIQDESINISWRKFPIEAYKNIIENKGKITNLVGVGYIFLVHTEHSLFMFDTNNMINAINTNLQISQQDAFEVDYKEIFTSLLGYGGLQDDKSWILDNFGYIYYNNDFNHFYKFDNGKLDIIDADIIQWLNKHKPYNIRFANDKINNRLLIKMNYNINNEVKNIVLSYNYNTNTFISLHSYYFDEAYNTKTQLYLKCNDIHHDCSLHQFIQDGSSYGKFDNIIETIGKSTIKPSKISIIVNPSYLDIKWLEHITYKLTKFINASEIDYTISPVEGEKQPFSGNLIKVYNNLIDTGELDITIDNENDKNIFCNYTKPYWDLGNWNFNYLRNNIVNHASKPFTDVYSRLYGNYFIIEFTFNNEDELKVEFEELDCKLIK